MPLIIHASQHPQSLSTDQRMRVVAYDPNNIVTLQAHQLIQTSIELGHTETIVGVEGGDSVAWTISINPSKPNILFLKPTVDSSDSNLTVLTDKHTYHFHVKVSDEKDLSGTQNSTSFVTTIKPEAVSATSPAVSSNASAAPGNPSSTIIRSIPDVTYHLRFTYPSEEKALLLAQQQKQQREKKALVNPHAINPLSWNWEYSFSKRCDSALIPTRVFDDGKFTYFQFKPHTDIPAIFVVEDDGKEALANWRIQNPYIVVERTASQFSLRHGTRVSCVLNDHWVHS